MTIQLTQDKTDLVDTKWHTGIAPYFTNAGKVSKLLKFFEIFANEDNQNRNKMPDYVSMMCSKRSKRI